MGAFLAKYRNIKNGYYAFIVNDKLCFLDLQQGEIIEYY